MTDQPNQPKYPKTLDDLRQPGPVHIDFTGDQRDIEAYICLVKRFLGTRGCNIERSANQLAVYPDAINN